MEMIWNVDNNFVRMFKNIPDLSEHLGEISETDKKPTSIEYRTYLINLLVIYQVMMKYYIILKIALIRSGINYGITLEATVELLTIMVNDYCESLGEFIIGSSKKCLIMSGFYVASVPLYNDMNILKGNVDLRRVTIKKIMEVNKIINEILEK
jgi:hypothetical protein